jgi:hypothetical protein
MRVANLCSHSLATFAFIVLILWLHVTAASSSLNRVRPVRTARAISWILRRIVFLKTEIVTDMKITVEAENNRELLAGRIPSCELTFGQIQLADKLYVSGGGRVQIKDLNIRKTALLFDTTSHFLRGPYTLQVDALLTQSDIVNSKFIREMLQLLTNTVIQRGIELTVDVGRDVGTGIEQRILGALGGRKMVSDVATFLGLPLPAEQAAPLAESRAALLERVRAGLAGEMLVRRASIFGRRIIVEGAYQTTAPGRAPEDSVTFEVSLGVGTRSRGQVVYLKDINFTLNPDSALLRASVPVAPSVPIDVDLGNSISLDSLVITDTHVSIKATCKISPFAPDSSPASASAPAPAPASAPVSPDPLQGPTPLPDSGDGNLNSFRENGGLTVPSSSSEGEGRPAQRPARALYFYDLGALLSGVLQIKGGFLKGAIQGMLSKVKNP